MGVGVGLILIRRRSCPRLGSRTWTPPASTSTRSATSCSFVGIIGVVVFDDLLVELGRSRLLRRGPQTTNDRSRGRRLRRQASYGRRVLNRRPTHRKTRPRPCESYSGTDHQEMRQFATEPVT